MGFVGFKEELSRRWQESIAVGGNRNLVVVEESPSTQELARRMVREYATECCESPPAALVAFRQSSGRGRAGRCWESPPGGVYVTLIRKIAPAERLTQVPLAVAVALAGELNHSLSSPCGLRWPNDLMVRGRKIGGILLDAMSRGDEGALALVGFGVNYDSAPIPDLTTCLTEHAPDPPSSDALILALVAAVDRYLASLENDAALLTEYAAGSVHRPGDKIRCRIGDAVKKGVFRGFATGGFLRLETDEGIELMTAGEIAAVEEKDW